LRNITHAYFSAKSCDELLEWSVGTVVAIIRKLRIDRDIQLPEKIQGELPRFKRRPFIRKLITF
jgi:hypothetical protein